MSTAGSDAQQQQLATDPAVSSPAKVDHAADDLQQQQSAEQSKRSNQPPHSPLDDLLQQRLEIDPDLVAASEALSSGFAPPSGPPAYVDSHVGGQSAEGAASDAHLHDGAPQTVGRDKRAQDVLSPYADDPNLNIPTHAVDSQLGDGSAHGALNQHHHLQHQHQQQQQQQQQSEQSLDGGSTHAPLSADGSSSAAPKAKKPSQRGGPGGGSVNETGLRKPASQLRNEGKPPKGVTECVSCGLKESPEWRKGESGLKDLCNACGLRHARLVAKRAGKIRPRKKKNKDPVAAAADGPDGAESPKRGTKRARVSQPSTSADGSMSTSSQQGATGRAQSLDPTLSYNQYGHGSTQQQQQPGGYYPSPAGGDGSNQQQGSSSSSSNGLLAPSHTGLSAGQSSPHQLPPIDTSAYASSGSGINGPGGVPSFYNNPIHSQLQQQQQMAHARLAASASPAGFNSNGGANQLPPLSGGGVSASSQTSFYAPTIANNYFYGNGISGNGARPFDTHAQQQLQQAQQQHQHQQTALNQALAVQGGYTYYQQSHLVNTGTYDPQLGQQQQHSSQPHTPLQSQQSQQQQQQKPASGGNSSSSNYYTPSFPNYGYQMQPGHFPDGYASAQAQATAATASSGSGGIGGQAGSQQPESEERGNASNGKTEHHAQQPRAQEEAA